MPSRLPWPARTISAIPWPMVVEATLNSFYNRCILTLDFGAKMLIHGWPQRPIIHKSSASFLKGRQSQKATKFLLQELTTLFGTEAPTETERVEGGGGGQALTAAADTLGSQRRGPPAGASAAEF